MPKRIIISVTNDLSSDQRVHRVAETLVDGGYSVLLVGRKKRKSKPLAPRRYATKRMKLVFQHGKFFYLEYAFRLFWLLLFKKTDSLLSNDLDTLLPNFLVAKLRRKRLIYDSHEYFTEVPELVERRLTRAIWVLLEKITFPRVHAAYTVNESLANIYSKKYGITVHSIRNLPLKNTPVPPNDDAPSPPIENPPVGAYRHTPEHEDFPNDSGNGDVGNDGVGLGKGMGGNQKTLIYQGALNMGRGIELMIEAMRHLEGYTLWIIGTGDLDDLLRGLADQYDLGDKVIFKGFVQFDELKSLTPQADLGLSLEQDRGASYHYALPNKLFDYIQAGLPVLVSDLPEMRRVVDEYGVGEILPADSRAPEQVAARIQRLCENQPLMQQYQSASRAAAQVLTWENEKEKLGKVFRIEELGARK